MISLQQTLRDSVIGRWSPAAQNRLVGATAKLVPDLSLFGRHMTMTNMDPATDWVATGGVPGIDFDGSNDIASTPLIFTGPPCTFVCWCKQNAAVAYGGPFGSDNVAMLSNLAGTAMTYVWAATPDEYDAITGLTFTADIQFRAMVVTSTFTTLWLDSASWTRTKAHGSKTFATMYLGVERNVHLFNGTIYDSLLLSTALNDSQIAELRRLGPGGATLRRRRIYAPSSSGYTAIGGVSVGTATCSGSATYTVPTFEATSAVTVGAITCSGSATHTAPTFEASSANTIGAAVCSGSATHTVPTFDATSAVSIGAVTCSGVATHTVPTFEATAATTIGAVTCLGTASSSGFDATSSVTTGAAICSGSATHTVPVYDGTGTTIVGAITCTGNATHTVPTYDGTSAVSVGAITCTGTATHTIPTYDGTSAVSAGAAICTGSATYADPGTFAGIAVVTVGPVVCSATATFTSPPETDSGSSLLMAMMSF